MIPPEDREALRSFPTARVVAEYLGLHLRQGRRGRCPLCNPSERSTAFSVSPDGRVFHCHRCGEGGDGIKLARLVYGMRFEPAFRLVAELCGVLLGSEMSAADRQRLRAAAIQRKQEQEAARKRADWLRRALNAVCYEIHELRWRRKLITKYPRQDSEIDADDLAFIAHREAGLLYLYDSLCDRDAAVVDAALERWLDKEVLPFVEVEKVAA